MPTPADPVTRSITAVSAVTLLILLVAAILTTHRPPGAGGPLASDSVAIAGGHPDLLDVGEGAEPQPPGEDAHGHADEVEPQETVPADAAETAPDPQAVALAPLTEPDRTAISWATGGLREGFAKRVEALETVERMTLVRAGLLELSRSLDADGAVVDAPSGGFVLPLDALAVNTDTYPAFYEDAEAIAALGRDQAIIGETSAELRGIGEGGVLELSDGHRLDVVAVLPDEIVGGAEVMVDLPTGRSIGADRERFVLVHHTGDLEALEREIIRSVAPVEDRPLRVLPGGEQRILRHGIGVLTQAEVKTGFGEFAYRDPGPSRQIVQDPAWRDANIVRARVPIIGEIRCHRKMIEPVREILTEFQEAGLSHLVDPRGYAGCWNARLTNRQDAVSRHSWGIGIDLNFPDNLVGTEGSMDPRLIEAFAERGFTWGGEWLLTDPTHFELVEDPES